MDACPACTASLARDSAAHCDSPTCIWLTCGKCHTRISPDGETYFRTGIVWGNNNGYIKAADKPT